MATRQAGIREMIALAGKAAEQINAEMMRLRIEYAPKADPKVESHEMVTPLSGPVTDRIRRVLLRALSRDNLLVPSREEVELSDDIHIFTERAEAHAVVIALLPTGERQQYLVDTDEQATELYERLSQEGAKGVTILSLKGRHPDRPFRQTGE